MKISYAITVCDEFIEIQRLVNFLIQNKDTEDEIVVQMDLSVDDLKNISEEKRQIHIYLMKLNSQGSIRVVFYPLNNDFAKFKNHLTEECKGDWIIQLDADEMITETFLKYVKESIKLNPEMHVFIVPRINTVKGLTQEHIDKWGWQVNEQGWVNFPDYQQRVYINNGVVKWKNKVHEQLTGHSFYGLFPNIEEICIQHHKTIERQEKQNNFYETL